MALTAAVTTAAAAGLIAPASAAPTRARIAYVANSIDNTVTPISTATNKPGQAINVGTGPAAIAIQPK